MGLSHLELERMLDELSFLRGSSLQEVYQPSPTELVLELRAGRENHLLLLSVQNTLARLHLIGKRPPNPLKPFPFQMLCRKELQGRLSHIEQLPGERLIKMHFEGTLQRTLQCELLDRHGNLLLLDGEGLLMGTLLTSRQSDRPLQLQLPVPPLPPPPPHRLVRDRFLQRPDGQRYTDAVEQFFNQEVLRLAILDSKSRLASGLRREIKRLERRLEDLQGDLKKAETAEKHRHFGDLLQIHLRSARRGMHSLAVPDVFQDPAPILEIPLDPLLDAVGNVQRHYRLYKKYDSSIPMVLERLESAEQELQRLSRLVERTEAASSLEMLENLNREARLPQRSQVKGRTRLAGERLPYTRYLTPHHAEIWVGRSAQDNDTLTFRVARGNDVWLHVRGRPGAHVVVPARPQQPDLDTLLCAALLTLKHSGLPVGEKAEVAWTRAKYVRKIAGGHPGQVTYTQDKTLYVALDSEKLGTLTRIETDEG